MVNVVQPEIYHHFYIEKEIPKESLDIVENQVRKFLTKKPTVRQELSKRLSGISSLSSSSGSSGNFADISSSGASSISAGNGKRDRLSLMPDTEIKPHKIVSPLPSLRRKIVIPEENETKTETEKKKTKIKVGFPVFAKWADKTSVNFYSGKIKTVAEDKYDVLFDDGFEKQNMVPDIDFILAESLEPGMAINVMTEKNMFRVGTILHFADCSKSPEDIYYNVKFEGSDFPEVDEKAYSHKKMHLSQDQMNYFTDEKGASLKKNGTITSDVSLDNLVTSKRQSKPITPIKTTPRRAKKGGSAIETSADEDVNTTPSRRRGRNARKPEAKVWEPSSSTEEETKRATTPRKGRNKAGLKSMVFDNLSFLITQGKHAPEDEYEYETESENEDAEEDPNDIKPLGWSLCFIISDK